LANTDFASHSRFGFEPLVRHLAKRPRCGRRALVGFALFGWVDVLREQALCFEFGLAGHRESNRWVRAERDGLLLAGESIRQPPELGSLRITLR
jgi:hypothetical protein